MKKKWFIAEMWDGIEPTHIEEVSVFAHDEKEAEEKASMEHDYEHYEAKEEEI